MSQPPLGSNGDKASGLERLDAGTSQAVGGKPFLKPADGQQLELPTQSSFTRTSDTISDYSIYSADNVNERQTRRLLAVTGEPRLAARSSTPTTWKGKAVASWARNKGLVLVILSQLFGTMMNVTTRLLEMDGNHGPGMHPFQVGSPIRPLYRTFFG